jgi:signal transduction histidine kinase
MKLSTRISLGFGLILLIFGIVAVINIKLLTSVNDNTNFLIKSEALIRNSGQYQRSVIDMENAFRGYLLSGDSTFLKSYDSNSVQIIMLYNILQGATPDTSLQTKLLVEINNLYKGWKINIADPTILKKTNSDNDLSRLIFKSNNRESKGINNRVGKNITDLIKSKFRQFNIYEYLLREQRRDQLRKSIENTVRGSIFLIICAIIFSTASALYVTRFLVKRINGIVAGAEEIADGNFALKIVDENQDEMVRLSLSLNLIARKLGENFRDLEKKNLDLNQFAHIVSHDLKAPLRGIAMVMDWIDEDTNHPIDDKVQEYHNLIRGRLQRMENLITGILDISRIGRIKRPVESVNVAGLIEEVIGNLVVPKNFQIVVEAGMPVIFTEKILLQQVFSNLIGNAIKYHNKPNGRIVIKSQMKENIYEFSVIDDGPGIAPEYHAKVFEIFQTLQERDAFESTGIGLAIVKKIVLEKGGKIWIESNLGSGATFNFTWPKFGEEL